MKKRKMKEKFITQEEFFKLFETYIKDSLSGTRVQKNGKRIKDSTINSYTYTYKLLKQYSTDKNKEIKLFYVNRLTASELKKAQMHSNKFYKSFTDYLYNDLDCYDNYVGTVIKHLRTFLNYLNNELNLNIGNFHRFYYIYKEQIPIITLMPEQLNYLIYDKEFNRSINPVLSIVKDIFIFGCTVGLRVSDLMSLKPHNLRFQNGTYYIHVKSTKTSVYTSIKLPEYAIEIVKKYSNNKEQKTLLPNYSLDYFNMKLKELAKHITDNQPIIKVREKRGVPCVVYKDKKKKEHFTMSDFISSHTMRRTAITNMLRLGMPEHIVRKISGHAAGSKEFFRYVEISQSYLDFECDKVFKKMEEFKID
jgi:integrase